MPIRQKVNLNHLLLLHRLETYVLSQALGFLCGMLCPILSVEFIYVTLQTVCKRLKQRKSIDFALKYTDNLT